MSLTLVEGAKYSNDVLQVGVIEKLVYGDPILERIKWKDITGNGLTYDVENALSGVSFYAVGDPWNESTSVVDQTTAVLKIMGGDADVDNFIKATRSNLQDVKKEQIDAKTKALRHKWSTAFYYGYITGNAREFDGMHYLLRSSTSPYNNVVATATSSGTSILLKMERVEKAVDICRDGADLIVMSKQMRRSINKYLHGVGGISYRDAGNGRIQQLYEIDVAVSDEIRDNEAADLQYGTNESGTAVYGHNYADTPALDDDGATSIFVLKFESDACCGVQNGLPTVVPIGDLETKDADRTRIKWYTAIMLQKIVTCSKVTGIDVDGVVAA